MPVKRLIPRMVPGDWVIDTKHPTRGRGAIICMCPIDAGTLRIIDEKSRAGWIVIDVRERNS